MISRIIQTEVNVICRSEGTVWYAVNVKSRKMVQTKTVCFNAARKKTLVVSSRGKQEKIYRGISNIFDISETQMK